MVIVQVWYYQYVALQIWCWFLFYGYLRIKHECEVSTKNSGIKNILDPVLYFHFLLGSQGVRRDLVLFVWSFSIIAYNVFKISYNFQNFSVFFQNFQCMYFLKIV